MRRLPCLAKTALALLGSTSGSLCHIRHAHCYTEMGSERPSNFSWVRQGLAGCAIPYRRGHFEFLLENGIKHIVTLTQFVPPMYLAPPGLNHVFLPVEEFEAPNLEQIIKFVEIVEEAVSKNEGVAVHCHWGRGRTGTVMAAYLVRAEHMLAADAIREIRRLRPYSIETVEQERAVIRYAEHLRTSAPGEH